MLFENHFDPTQVFQSEDILKMMELKTELFEVQGMLSTNLKGDSKMDIVG